MNNWDEIIEGLRPNLDALHKAREAALSAQRQIIQLSSKSIRHVHRHQYDEARALLRETQTKCRDARAAIADVPEILYHGYLQDAEKEMVEAAALIALVTDQPIPSPTELGVQPASYLNGVAEAASEGRRYILDEMRNGRFERAQSLLETVESIYDDLITFDYPDSVTGGLRRTCDALRAVLERTRSDLTLTQSQMELLAELRAARTPT